MSAASKEIYMLPRDASESDRLERQHLWVKAIAGHQLLHPIIPTQDIEAVADIATGTGVWICDLARTWKASGNSTTHFHGFDISPDQFPQDGSSGVQFSVHDATVPFPDQYHGYFDIINVRLMSYAIRVVDLEKIVANLVAILKPNGFINWQEFDMLDAWTLPATQQSRLLVRTVIEEREARGLTAAIAIPLAHALSSCTVRLPHDQVNPTTWDNRALRVMRLETISTQDHPDPVARGMTSPIIKQTTASLLKSGIERLSRLADTSSTTQVDTHTTDKITRMSALAESLLTESSDPGDRTWHCEMTWIVARKAVTKRQEEDWMSARYS